MQLLEPGQQLAWASLQRRWLIFMGLCLLFLIGGLLALSVGWGAKYASIWLIFPTLNIVYLLFVLRRNLTANHRTGENTLLPSLGWGNHLTLLRGVLVAGMMGFLFQPQPPGWMVWIPGLLYILSDIADFSDGLVARLTNHATRLGEILDMSFDGLGVLVASILAIQYGQVPVWYLTVAFARPLFLAGLWLRRRLNKPSHDLPPSTSRRVFAGFQMGFLAVVLWPLFSPPGTLIAATLFGLPLLIGFARDWLAVSGNLRLCLKIRGSPQKTLIHWLPVLLRLGILALSLGLLRGASPDFKDQGTALLLLGGLHAAATILIVFGAAARFSAILALCLLGFYQMFTSLTPVQFALGAIYTAILYLGSGAFSLWTPEDQLVYRRAGEPRTVEVEQGL